jgi:predicted transcriptional regulator
MEEIAVVVGVRMLEDNSVLPPSTADEMAREAIQEITKSHSERIGKLLEAINDKFLRERR